MEQAALDEATRHELEELKYRYLRGIDTKDWDLVADTLCQDVVGEWSGGALHYEGRAAVIGFFTEAMGRESFLSAHRVTIRAGAHRRTDRHRHLGADRPTG